MTLNDQLIVTIADKLIIGVIILLAVYFLNRSLEKFKVTLTKQNKIRDIKFEKISQIVEEIWKCNLSFERMLATYAKSKGEGPFDGISDILEKDKQFRKQMQEQHLDFITEYCQNTNSLKEKIDSSYFWIGNELSEKAKHISAIYMDYVYTLMNKNISHESLESIKNIDKNIREFENLALEYLG